MQSPSIPSPATAPDTIWKRFPSRWLPTSSSARLALLMIVGAALVAGGLMWANTRWGVGLRGDSFAYISGARGLAAGLGYSRISGGGEINPITHFPPLLSIVLAGAELVGWDAAPGARTLVIALMAVNTLLAGALGWQIAGRPWAGAVGAVLFGPNPQFVDVHSWAIAERLSIALTLGMYWSLARAAGEPSARCAFLPGLLAGLPFQTRYFGATDPVTGLPRHGHDEWLSLAKDTLAQRSAAPVLVNVERLMTDAEDRAMVEAWSDGLKNEVIYEDGVILTAGGLP